MRIGTDFYRHGLLQGAQASPLAPFPFIHRWLIDHDSPHVMTMSEKASGWLVKETKVKPLPGRLELPTLRLTASRSNQLS